MLNPARSASSFAGLLRCGQPYIDNGVQRFRPLRFKWHRVSFAGAGAGVSWTVRSESAALSGVKGIPLQDKPDREKRSAEWQASVGTTWRSHVLQRSSCIAHPLYYRISSLGARDALCNKHKWRYAVNPQQVSKGVSTMKHTTEQLEAIAAKLREMPPVEKKKQEHSKQDAVRILSKEIALLQKAWIHA